jgi:hypothetical protein
MSRSATARRDLLISALCGFGVEAMLAALNFIVEGDLMRDHPWLQISQKPGAEIAERLFRYVPHGVLPAIACVILVQAVIFASLAFTIIQVVRHGTHHRERQGVGNGLS